MPPNKRARAALCSPRIIDLPDNVLSDVSSYLPAPSRALFAVAEGAPPSSWREHGRPSAVGRAILSSPAGNWDALNFGEIDKSLAERLTDDDVAAVLACIDAPSHLKTLRLSGCVNITGRGLGALRNSTLLEDVDISLVGLHESPILDPEPKLAEAVVVPMLQSLVDSSALKFLVLPKAWSARARSQRGEPNLLVSFLRSFNELLNSRENKCSKCRSVIAGPQVIHNDDRYFGEQSHFCHVCKKSFCYCEGENESPFLGYCEECKREYCIECSPVQRCFVCDDYYCGGCATFKQCQDCREMFCGGCGPEGSCACWGDARCNACAPEYVKCQRVGCSKANCTDCLNDDDKDVQECDDCQLVFCANCRYLEHGPEPSCEGCMKLIIRTMMPKLTRKVNELRMENDLYKDEIDKLRKENEELRKVG